MMDKQVMSSVLCSDTAGRYAVGILKEGMTMEFIIFLLFTFLECHMQ